VADKCATAKSVAVEACDCAEGSCRVNLSNRDDCLYARPGSAALAPCETCDKHTFHQDGACVDCFERWALTGSPDALRATAPAEGAGEAE
jgi:hypothetical protein